MVVLDPMLPDRSGAEVLAALLARQPNARVFVLSAVPEIGTRVHVLDAGALDFLPKPFVIAELLARLRARLREPLGAGGGNRFLQVGNLRLDIQRRTVSVGNQQTALSHREFILLNHLMQRADQVCSREELLADVWGYQFDPGSNVVDVYVRRLRSKLDGLRRIETVPMWVTASPRAKRAVLITWVLFALVNLWAMWRFCHSETIPFHFVWISIAVVFGVNSWPMGWMMTALAAVTVSTGAIMLDQAIQGEIRFEETSEVPLMAALFLVMVWHVRGRQRALVELERVAALERQRAETQGLFVRLGSHELRTSITVARGYAELIRTAHDDQQTEDDTSIVLDELSKLDRLTGRLTTLMQLDSPMGMSPLDLDVFLDRLVRRWTPVAERQWSAQSKVGTVDANEERLQAAMDSLIENAIAFTRNGGRIEVRAWREPGLFLISVSDSGTGIADEHVGRIFERSWSTRRGQDRAGHGLGLAIVRAAVEARGGSVSVRSTPGHGAKFTLRFPERVGEPRAAGGVVPSIVESLPLPLG
jgi:signal transduction histidine kinase/DNA-binding response OmpR family regulator